jgi:hypothetical protein
LQSLAAKDLWNKGVACQNPIVRTKSAPAPAGSQAARRHRAARSGVREKPATGGAGVAPGFAAFVIARRDLAARGTAVLVTSTIFPHDRMRYSMSLKLT